MTVLLTCSVTIAGNLFPVVSEVDVSSSWKENGDFATIKMPRTFKFGEKNISEVVNCGDTVKIEAGYNGNLTTIFEGYVSKVKPEIPVIIECEDEIYNLKKNQVADKFFDNANLRDIIRHIAPQYYNEQTVRDVKIGDFIIKNATPAKVLQVLREEFGLPSFFQNGKLFSGASYFDLVTTQRHKFDTAKNMRESNLQYQTGDAKLMVKCVGILAGGTKVKAEFGDAGGETRTFLYDNISEKKELEKLAKQRHQNTKLDGYNGTFTGWGEPIMKHGDVAIINDVAYNGDRTGNYMVDGCKINISGTGYKRTYTIGSKTT